MDAPERSLVFLLDLMTKLGDVVGEKGMHSLMQYAAAEVGGDLWSQMLPPRQTPVALKAVADAIGIRVEIASHSEDGLVLRIASRGTSPARVDAVREAILIGALQGIERRRTGRTPAVSILASSAAATPAQGRVEVG